jgi:MoaA/NifB/PqqE/SkfB family radical SAM enzyme
MGKNALSAPLALCLELTYACNLRCVHCMSGNKGAVYASDEAALLKIVHRELPTEVFRDLIDQAAEAKVFYLYLSGGEPLVHPACIDLAAYGTARGMRVALFSDAIGIDDGMARRLVDAGVMNLQTNLDGASAEVYDKFRGVPGSFEATVRGIRAAVRAGLYVRANITITRMTLGELPAVVALARELGLKELIALPLRRAGRALRYQADLELSDAEFEAAAVGWRRLKETLPPGFLLSFERDAAIGAVMDPSCSLPADGGGRYHCCVTPTGLVKPEPESPNDPEWIAGDVTKQRLLDIWRSSPLFKAMRDPALPEYDRCLLRVPHGACPARFREGADPAAPPEEACSYCNRYFQKERGTWRAAASTW